MPKNKLILSIALVAILACMVGRLFVSFDIRDIIIALLHVTAGVLFILGLSNFKAMLRVAYISIAAGFALVGLSAVQFPLITALHAWDSPWVKYGGIGLPFIVSNLAIYFGVHRFARVVDVKSYINIPALAIGISILIGALTSQVPHVASSLPEQAFDISAGLFAAIATLLVFSGYVTLRIKREVSVRFNRTLYWLVIACWMAALALLHNLAVQLFVSQGSWYAKGQFTLYGELAAGVAVLVAGYLFSNVGRRADERVMQDPAATCVTLITYMASLASDVRAIDPILDGLRFVTANYKPGSELSEVDQQRLAKVYQELLAYLTLQERLQKFTQDEMTQTVLRRFGNVQQANPVFWRQIMPRPSTVPLASD